MPKLKRKLAVFGLGHIGLPFIAALANVGYNVVGVDVDEKRIDMLKSGGSPFYEPGMREALEACRDKIEYTTDSSYAMETCNCFFITVGTPVKENDNTDSHALEDIIKREFGKSLGIGGQFWVRNNDPNDNFHEDNLWQDNFSSKLFSLL